MKRSLPIHCPSCNHTFKVSRLICTDCDTAVEGSFNLSTLIRLSPEDQEFAVMFIKSSGSLKDLAKIYKISYPTVMYIRSYYGPF